MHYRLNSLFVYGYTIKRKKKKTLYRYIIELIYMPKLGSRTEPKIFHVFRNF